MNSSILHQNRIQPTAADALSQIERSMRDCTLCPRICHANRLEGKSGYCGQGATITAARAALHFWEEPCISGTNGSGTVFFSGCNLQCVFCQNHDIALSQKGREIAPDRLADIFLELQKEGANNINLVTPSHFIPQVCYALIRAKENGLSIPVVYNTGSYEEVSSLRLLDGLIDIYLPDLKYYSPELSSKYSHATDYFEKATAAIAEMFRQVGTPVFAAEPSITNPEKGIRSNTTQHTVSQEILPDENSLKDSQENICITSKETLLMKRGIIVRHLLLPGQSKDSKKILRYLHETYGDDIYVSIMNQYTPLSHTASIPELNRKVTPEEYDRVLRFAEAIGIQNGFLQEDETASESFIPPFNFEGIL